MGHKKNGPAAGDGRVQRDDFSRWHTNNLPRNNQVATSRQEPIRAELSGSSVCIAAGLKINTGSPVLAICRQLIEAGVDPALRLECYRGDVLALSVSSIAIGAQLRVRGNGAGFEITPTATRPTAPPVGATAPVAIRMPGARTMTLEPTDLEGGRAMTTLRNSRAATVAVAITQIIKTAPHQKRQQQVEQYLANEFEDERRQTIADRELSDA
jgi:hypothetical protein